MIANLKVRQLKAWVVFLEHCSKGSFREVSEGEGVLFVEVLEEMQRRIWWQRCTKEFEIFRDVTLSNRQTLETLHTGSLILVGVRTAGSVLTGIRGFTILVIARVNQMKIFQAFHYGPTNTTRQKQRRGKGDYKESCSKRKL